eukprot:TRINITY_DN1365_c0_g1_i2.p1 TRINITY_DN1365_c0_g1~~TRINITY_DN1365_c0_g1_i2.p1  ORF type:complete len:111 (+),score=22.11 TRINITY_DN1365_c0_g1_i2:1-333(+)
MEDGISTPYNFKHLTHINEEYAWVFSNADDFFNHFRLDVELGRGAFGCVWKAVETRSGMEIAIKQVELRMDDDEVEKEIDVLKQCNNDHLVSFYGTFRYKDYLWVPFSPL